MSSRLSRGSRRMVGWAAPGWLPHLDKTNLSGFNHQDFVCNTSLEQRAGSSSKMVVLWRQKPQDKTHHSTTLQTLPSAGLFDPQDPEEEEQILLFAIILILVIPGGWKWAGDVLGEKLGNGWREREEMVGDRSTHKSGPVVPFHQFLFVRQISNRVSCIKFFFPSDHPKSPSHWSRAGRLALGSPGWLFVCSGVTMPKMA